MVEKQGKGKKRKFAGVNLLVEIFFVCVRVFLKENNIYSHTHSTDAVGKVTNKFSPGRFLETGQLFFGLNACFMVIYRWTFYISILGEFKLLLKSNAEIVVFYDVLAQRKII